MSTSLLKDTTKHILPQGHRITTAVPRACIIRKSDITEPTVYEIDVSIFIASSKSSHSQPIFRQISFSTQVAHLNTPGATATSNNPHT